MNRVEALQAACDAINADRTLPQATLWKGTRVYLQNMDGWVYANGGALKANFAGTKTFKAVKRLIAGIAYEPAGDVLKLSGTMVAVDESEEALAAGTPDVSGDE